VESGDKVNQGRSLRTMDDISILLGIENQYSRRRSWSWV